MVLGLLGKELSVLRVGETEFQPYFDYRTQDWLRHNDPCHPRHYLVYPKCNGEGIVASMKIVAALTEHQLSTAIPGSFQVSGLVKGVDDRGLKLLIRRNQYVPKSNVKPSLKPFVVSLVSKSVDAKVGWKVKTEAALDGNQLRLVSIEVVEKVEPQKKKPQAKTRVKPTYTFKPL